MLEKIDHAKFIELYKKLPVDLQDAIYAQETGEKIEGICERNKTPELFDFINNGIGDVYLGVMAPDDFFAALEKELEGKTGIRQIKLEINNFLLFPYKASLEKIYNLQAPAAGIPPAPAAAPAAGAATTPIQPVQPTAPNANPTPPTI
jgi:hypothetical protein